MSICVTHWRDGRPFGRGQVRASCQTSPRPALGSITACSATWRLLGENDKVLSALVRHQPPSAHVSFAHLTEEVSSCLARRLASIYNRSVAVHAMMRRHQPIGPTVRGTATLAAVYADPHGCDVSSQSPAAGGGPPRRPSPVLQWMKRPGLVDIRRRSYRHGQAHIVMAGATREQSVQNDIASFSLRAYQSVSTRSPSHQ